MWNVLVAAESGVQGTYLGVVWGNRRGQSTFSEMVKKPSGSKSTVQPDIQYVSMEYLCRIGIVVLVWHCYFGAFMSCKS